MRAILERLVLLCVCYGCNKLEQVSIGGELKPRTMKELMEVPGGDWERVDIGRMNLICARDADGTDRIDVERMVKMLDKWAEIAKATEERYRKSFEAHPERYDNSYVVKKGDNPVVIANCMRNIIDAFFAFVEKKDYGSVFQKKELSGNKYQSFCRFMNRESHSDGQNIFDLKEYDYEAYKEALGLVFRLNGYEEHYKAMMRD